MSPIGHLVLGTLAATALSVGAAWLSAAPAYRALPEGMALVKLSFSHGGARNCRTLTEAELAKLPPNMRRKEVCDRGRAPVLVELDIDGTPVFHANLPPTGIAGDGPSQVYERFLLPAGTHDFVIRLRDTTRTEGFDQSAEQRVVLVSEQSLAIDFRPAEGGFIFR